MPSRLSKTAVNLRQKGDKPLPEPILTQCIDIYIWHYGEMSLANYQSKNRRNTCVIKWFTINFMSVWSIDELKQNRMDFWWGKISIFHYCEHTWATKTRRHAVTYVT